jgi:3'(2'), 5'-bisphosphate nucleotidase
VLNATELLEALVLAALEAGRVECEIYAGAIAVQHKEDNSPVTAADHAAEAIILARLAQAAPHIPIVAEEEVAAGRVPKVDADLSPSAAISPSILL